MATTIGTAYVQILPTLDGAKDSLTQQLNGATTEAASEAGGKAGSGLVGGIAKGLAGGAAVIGAAGAAAIGGMTALTSSVASYGDEIDKNSQKLGVSSTFYQQWDAVLQHSGTSMDSMTSTFKTLANASQDATADQAAAFEKLGLSMDEVASMSTEDLFTSVITGLQGMEEGTERAALANDLLGRGATEMGALLNTSAEDTQGMIDTVTELGGVMSEDAVKSAAAYQDSLQDMQTAMGSVKNEVGAELMPVFTDMMNMVIENMPQIKEAIGPVVESIGQWVGDIAQWVTDHGEEISGVIDGICSVFGTVWDAISAILDSFCTAFSTVSDSIDSDGSLIDTVFEGIGTAVQTMSDLVCPLIELIGTTIAALVTEAQTDGTLINTVWENIQTAVSTTIEAVTGIIDALIALLNGDFTGAFDAIGGVVDTIFTGMWTVVENNMGWISDKVSSVVNSIKEWWSGISFDLPHISMPNLVITPGEAPWGIGGFGYAPSIDIEWHAKAMNNAMVLRDPTIFGMGSDGQLLGGGEAGNEVVAGEDYLMNLIGNAVTDGLDGRLSRIINIMERYMPGIGQAVAIPVDTLADRVGYELQRTADRQVAAYG